MEIEKANIGDKEVILDYAPRQKKLSKFERLVQEHAIYKAFFEGYRDRPMNGIEKPFVHTMDRTKCLAFEVVERLARLDRGITYYDASWPDADKMLFTIDIKSLNSDHG